MALIACSASAQTKPRVYVQFRMVYSEYLDFYTIGGSTTYINSTASSNLSDLLNKTFPFIQFSNSAADDTLKVTLDKDWNTDPLSITVPTEFRMTYKRKDKFTKEFKQTEIFREPGLALEGLPDDKNAFLAEIMNVLKPWIERNQSDMLTDIFGNVQICKNPLPLASEKKWIMPFSMEELEIGLQSILQIDTRIQGSLGEESCRYLSTVTGETNKTVPLPYQGKIFCSINQMTGNETCILKMKNARINGVYLVRLEKRFLTQTDPFNFTFSN